MSASPKELKAQCPVADAYAAYDRGPITGRLHLNIPGREAVFPCSAPRSTRTAGERVAAAVRSASEASAAGASSPPRLANDRVPPRHRLRHLVQRGGDRRPGRRVERPGGRGPDGLRQRPADDRLARRPRAADRRAADRRGRRERRGIRPEVVVRTPKRYLGRHEPLFREPRRIEPEDAVAATLRALPPRPPRCATGSPRPRSA